MKPGKVRSIAICVFRHADSIFVFEGHDPLKGETFYRPLGGTIEFGELSSQTVVRELREEIRAEVANLRYLGTLENVFTFLGKPGHEIVLVYRADFADPAFYDQETVQGFEDGDGYFKALWMPLSAFTSGAFPLYPSGLLELLLKA